MSIKTLLQEEIENELDKLATMEPGSEKYKATVSGLSQLMDRAIELEKLEDACVDKEVTRKSEELWREQQAKSETKDRIVRNIIGAAGVVLPLIVTIWGTNKCLKFEEEGTITTHMGRGFIQRLFPKK